MKTFYEMMNLMQEHELKPLTLDDMKTTSADDAVAWYEKYGKNTSKLGQMTDEEFQRHHGLIESPQLGNEMNPDAPDVNPPQNNQGAENPTDQGTMVQVPGLGEMTKEQARKQCIEKLQDLVDAIEQQDPIPPEDFDQLRDLYQASNGDADENQSGQGESDELDLGDETGSPENLNPPNMNQQQ